jgi:hypothetical protein
MADRYDNVPWCVEAAAAARRGAARDTRLCAPSPKALFLRAQLLLQRCHARAR